MIKLLEKIKNEFAKGRGVRIGEAAVASRKIHVISPERPQLVRIITNSDAGKVFYNRFNEGEIVHVDLFHEVRRVDVKKVAENLLKALTEVSKEALGDFIDIQTGSGGGRLTGTLNYGKTESLLKNHLNHVHLAVLLDDDNLDFLLFLIIKVEEALLEQGIEIRKVEKIRNDIGNTPCDLSPYATNSDSFLKQTNFSKGPFTENEYQRAIELSEYFGSINELQELLEYFKSEKRKDLFELKKKYGDLNEVLARLERNAIVCKKSGVYNLTKEGESLIEYIKQNNKEIELILKRMIRDLPKKGEKIITPAFGNAKNTLKNKGILSKKIYNKNEWLEEIEITETIKRALIRCYSERKKLSISTEDIVIIKRSFEKGQDICLLIDASASMAGERLRSAKYLAKHIVLTSYRRVSVLTFQEKEVKICVPFTKNFSQVDYGVSSIASSGLTPLALALERALSYMCSKNLKNPLIILVTDGIPTVPVWSTDPVKDAIIAAQNIRKKKIDFCCIGLQPNKDCLTKIVEAANGKLYIVEELDKDVLVNVLNNSRHLI
ncbi:magnesium chelatase subunit D [Caldanaerovirga acetigignens]|uniref:Magnesium chelatase subunit D n=1 Tax=Caldanaerovirga acetigignens TaxID=447595 RepID=A0A1M7JIP6_9FIRM|nr:VWA domain-containing protein [Caldanaerovirga acetigignens]SHM52771.1 magnesium chelatase subunit D [Caldanaerovirga acetigignens]